MPRFGQLSQGEYFVSEAAAKAGVVIENVSEYEPLVILKHFPANAQTRKRLNAKNIACKIPQIGI